MNSGEIKILILGKRLDVKFLYNKYRDEFLTFGSRYKLDEDTLEDIYQESFLAIRKHAIKGKLNDLKSSFKTYLFGIGKNKIFNVLKERKKNISFDDFHLNNFSMEEVESTVQKDLTEEQILLQKHFKKLGKKCKNVLTLFYYRGLSIKEIKEFEDYASENVVKALKSRCLKTLRDMIKNDKRDG